MLRCLLLLLLPMKLFAFSDKGVVTISFSGNRQHTVKIYKSATLPLPFCVCHTDDQLDSLLPSYYRYSGTSTISYCCAEETDDRYCIRTSFAPFIFYWIAKDTFTDYSSWNDWWKSWGETTVGSKDTLYKTPNDHAAIINNICACNIVSVDSLSGDWMKVIFDGYCMDEKENDCPLTKRKTEIWIRWRKSDEIVVWPYIAE